MKNINLKIIVAVGVLASVGVLFYLYTTNGGLFGAGPDSVSLSGADPTVDQGLIDVDDASSSLDGSSSSLFSDSGDDNSDSLADIQEIVGQPQKDSKTMKTSQLTKTSKTTATASQESSPQTIAQDSTSDDNDIADTDSNNFGDQTSSNESVISAPTQLCSFSTAGTLSHKIILNEVAWMGSPAQPGETGAAASDAEWIELKNFGTGAVDLSGWQVLDSTGNIKVVIGTATIPANGFYLLVRNGASIVGASADANYSGALSNSGEALAVFDPNCGASDILDASTGWPGGNNTTKQTLERDVDGVGWHTSVLPGGTPRVENSIPAPASSSSVASSTTPNLTVNSISVVTPLVPQQYIVSVSTGGNGIGTVSSNPTGILCGFTCEANYTAGTKIWDLYS